MSPNQEPTIVNHAKLNILYTKKDTNIIAINSAEKVDKFYKCNHTMNALLLF